MGLELTHLKKIASLSKISMSDAELDCMNQELSKILGWIDQLQQINTAASSIVSDEKMTEREDQVTDGNITKKVLSNAPEVAHDMFAVPKVIE